jgi:transposase
MPQQKKQRSAKAQALRQSGTFNPKAQEVQDRLFLEEEFFDAHDLAQVKYEMLRRVQKEGAQISQAASSFGFSRPSFYKAQADFLQEGLAGLIRKKRGPKGRHKLSAEIMDFVEQRRMQDPSLRVATLLELIQETFGTRVHRRTLERALVAAKKKPH